MSFVIIPKKDPKKLQNLWAPSLTTVHISLVGWDQGDTEGIEGGGASGKSGGGGNKGGARGEGEMGKRGEVIDANKPKPFCQWLC